MNIKEAKQKVAEFVVEMTQQYPDRVKSKRLGYLYVELQKLDELINDNASLVNKIKDTEGQEWFAGVVEEMNLIPQIKQANKIRLEIDVWEGKQKLNGSLSQSEIENARNVDCGLLVDVKRVVGGKSWAHCPFGTHDDKTPSFCAFPKEGGYYAFCCNQGGDAIDLIMKLNENMSFKEAVNYLNKI